MNENVTEFIKYYTSTEDKLDYAIFLEGEWGCGKTYYLKKTIKGLNLSERELYLSLYGINKMEEVNMKIKENLLLEMTPFMPPLDSENKVANFFISATRVANAVLQSKTGASLESIPDLLINKKEVAKKIIIVDDIERCTKNVEFQEILGYPHCQVNCNFSPQ
jgi:archaellum biogenesis ATPase FlaH